MSSRSPMIMSDNWNVFLFSHEWGMYEETSNLENMSNIFHCSRRVTVYGTFGWNTHDECSRAFLFHHVERINGVEFFHAPVESFFNLLSQTWKRHSRNEISVIVSRWPLLQSTRYLCKMEKQCIDAANNGISRGVENPNWLRIDNIQEGNERYKLISAVRSFVTRARPSPSTRWFHTFI